MQRQHAQALADAVRQARALLEPLLPKSQPEMPPTSSKAWEQPGADLQAAGRKTADWQATAQNLFPIIQKLDRLASILLAGANTDLTPDQVFRELATALAEAQRLSESLAHLNL
jgi:hypothetical protein